MAEHDRRWIVLSGKKLLQSCTSLYLQIGRKISQPGLARSHERKGGEEKMCPNPITTGEIVRTDTESGCSQPIWSDQGDREGTDLTQQKGPYPIRRKRNPCHSGTVPSLQGFSQRNQSDLE